MSNVGVARAQHDRSKEPARGGHDRWQRFAPWLAVAAATLFGLLELRSEASSVPYLNDSSVHEEMARFAMSQLQHGNLPLEGWFPFLGLGSPQFLHYQSLGAILTGLLGLGVGTNHAYSFELYLLLASWPVCIYVTCRLFQLERWPSAIAAACAPFLSSVIGIGYEQKSYLWVGYGIWAQLLAMWTLPLAWGLTWRAVSERRYVFPAVLFVALTIACHFLTGYLAVLPILLWPFLKPSQLFRRLLRAIAIAGGALAASAWVIVPVIELAKWTSLNEFLQGTPSADSYGARRVLSWLATGRLFDNGRWPVLTVLVAAGVLSCFARWRKDERARALLGVFVLCLVLFFGRPTLGPLLSLLPGNGDLFLRRFLMGVQLASVLLAGIGAMAITELVTTVFRRQSPRVSAWLSSRPSVVLGRRIVVAGGVVLALSPAWTQTASYDAFDAASIHAEQRQSAIAQPQIDPLISEIKRLGGGRAYAGLPTNWGSQFKVGAVPVFKYLSSKNVDEVGYTLRTASLMTDPEAYFDESLPSDYALFAVRYLILPAGHKPPIPAHLLARRGSYLLWATVNKGYVQVIDTAGSISANRLNIGHKTVLFVRSNLAGQALYPTIAFDGEPAPPPTRVAGNHSGPAPGIVLTEADQLAQGVVRARVVANRSAVVLLKVSFDPGWAVTVDGARAKTEMIAPALLGVVVRPGAHNINYRYAPYGAYPELFLLALVTLLSFLIIPMIWRKTGDRRREPLY